MVKIFSTQSSAHLLASSIRDIVRTSVGRSWWHRRNLKSKRTTLHTNFRSFLSRKWSPVKRSAISMKLGLNGSVIENQNLSIICARTLGKSDRFCCLFRNLSVINLFFCFCRFATGLEFRDNALIIALKTAAMVRKGMVFCLTVGFQNLRNAEGKTEDEKTFAVWIGDTIVVNEVITMLRINGPSKNSKV